MQILLTGGSGKLGKAITGSGKFPGILAPGHNELDITDPDSVKSYFSTHSITSIIHCAALARMAKCQEDPAEAVKTNVVGTANLVIEAMRLQKNKGISPRFIYISTDGVYESTSGGYKESDAPKPYNVYGWTKLGGECAVAGLPNHCIIRTSFFDPKNIPYDDAASDIFSSKMPISELVDAICLLHGSGFKGIINVGNKRVSDLARCQKYKKMNETSYEKIQSGLNYRLAKDSSMDTALWEKIKYEKK